MNLLRGLRLNCFLAALIPCLLACIGLAYQDMRNQQQTQLAYTSEARHSLSTYAELLKHLSHRETYLEAIQKGDDRWLCLAIINVNKNNQDYSLNIEMLNGSQTQLEIDNPHPLLIKGQMEAQHWILSTSSMAVACPLRNELRDMGVLYGEIRTHAQENNLTMIFILSGCLFIGILISIYLSHRIYKPIESLCDEAEAVMQGNATTAAIYKSSETAHVASSINDLLQQFQAQNSNMSSLDSGSLDSEGTQAPQHE